MLMTKYELKEKYQELSGKYEGYIQMSEGRIEYIFKEATKLPSWEELHDKKSKFIYEMVLYDVENKKSILVRQIDDGWVCVNQDIDWDSANENDKDIYFSIFDDKTKREIRAVQVWEEKDDDLSKGFKSLVPVGVFFAGFEKRGGQR